MILRNLDEGVGIALDALRSNKLRSALTILGVVIGVSTVMAMASIVEGIRGQIFNAMNTAGPSAFYVMRFFSQTPLNPDHLPYEVRIRPVLTEEDAIAVRDVPEIQYAGIWVQMFLRMEYQGVATQTVTVYGADEHYMEILGGTLLRGRFFAPSELDGEPVVVLEEESADRLFGEIDPMGRRIRVGGVALTVIGIYQRPANIFEPPGQQIGAIMPFVTAKRNYRYDETNGLFLSVKGWPRVSVPIAKDLTIAALRRERRLRPGMPNTFDVITQDQILDTISNLTTAFFGVMVALSSVALLVGGIGVMAIMMVSVTDRTREIGLRKALGATRQEILWQFLVESATLTFIGGLLGIAFGLATGHILKAVLDLQSGVPLWSAVLATLVSIGIGLVFGLYPANRAAAMDPVEALRHE
ncbi:MAG TPA: ABC transporter permease [Gemmatimonadales bacterium]|nr:ABC transporter permease [Gemmatimonadales bacterium]HSE68802.1 ABC transporter permease [Gemmatimonadales bacterium]